jgi:hypothetical protein
MDNIFDYIQVTDKNLKAKDAIFDAVVVSNYGDPGLDEDYHADILSRYVICKIESSNRTLTSDRYKNMIVLVKRPRSLWIDYNGGFLNAPINQQRVDSNLNSNIGLASNYSVNAIPRMNDPYKLGEKLKIKLIKEDSGPSFVSNQDYFFSSECPIWDVNISSSMYYGSWHTQGLNSDPYITANNGANNLRMKTIVPASEGGYTMTLNKIQYEAFSLTIFPKKANSLVSLFSNASDFNYYYNANGGYVFSETFSINLNFLKYEDMNVGNKARTNTTNCMPLIVAAPQTFTVPKSRNSGTVNYTPTYIEKS